MQLQPNSVRLAQSASALGACILGFGLLFSCCYCYWRYSASLGYVYNAAQRISSNQQGSETALAVSLDLSDPISWIVNLLYP
jgi:hypothetical protein